VVTHDQDEGFRRNANLAQMQKMKALKELQSKGKLSGRVTAALASQICDGAAAVMICNEEGLRKLGLAPRAKIVSLGLAASDPVTMLGGPIPASQQALARVNMSIDDIDLYVFVCGVLCFEVMV
jgi:acetyl-CoA C-acetyltransferase